MKSPITSKMLYMYHNTLCYDFHFFLPAIDQRTLNIFRHLFVGPSKLTEAESHNSNYLRIVT